MVLTWQLGLEGLTSPGGAPSMNEETAETLFEEAIMSQRN